MTTDERRERGTELCRRLSADVDKAVPKDIGAWSPAWEIVGDADAEFMLALTKWESTGTAPDKAALRAAYAEVLNMWRRALAAWEAVKT